jgi:Electron transfer DM13
MKFKSVISLGIISLSLLSLGTANTVSATMVNSAQSNNISTKVAGVNSQVGSFRKAEHPTQGMVRIINKNGKRYLKFDNNFKTESGPDLYVILYRNRTVPVSGIKAKDYVRVGRLQRINGSQLYAIPNNVSLGNYKSVAIWCRQFNATFGFAPFAS